MPQKDTSQPDKKERRGARLWNGSSLHKPHLRNRFLNEKIEIVEGNNIQKEPDQYSSFEVSCERGEFGYLGRMWHHDYLPLETAIMLAEAGYPYIKLI